MHILIFKCLLKFRRLNLNGNNWDPKHLVNFSFHVKEFYQLHRLIKMKRNVRKNQRYKKLQNRRGPMQVPASYKTYPPIQQLNLKWYNFLPLFFTFSFSLSRICTNLPFPPFTGTTIFFFSFSSSDGFSRIMTCQKLLYLHTSVYHNSEKPWLWLRVVKALL